MTLPEPSPRANDAAREVVDAAIQVHRMLGPGLLESHYREALAHELRRRGRTVEIEVPARVRYEGKTLRKSYSLDMRVDGELVVELKATPKLLPVHLAQTSSYLAATGHHLAILLNFHAPRMKDGIRRVIRSR
ncbi:MAG TPA: GxxExxY protein [Candidatus Thermoplasmatota archaeon]|nr:GxxExxY protein [Candidatus Thermoplasmatota archaeon]